MKKDMLSVIVPVYNVSSYLNRCIISIINQSYKNLEIILVDDGSTDNSGVICDSWATKDNRIIVIHKENCGLSDARNVGLKVSTGAYITFVDSDDWLDPYIYENLMKVGIGQKCDIVLCKFKKTVDENDFVTNDNDYRVEYYDTISALKALITDEIQQVVWNKIYSKRLIEGIYFETGKYHEDEFWSYKIIGCAKKVAAIDYIGYYYWQRSDSIMGEQYSLRRLDAIEAKVERQNYLGNYYPELLTYGKINLAFACMFHGQNAIQTLGNNELKKAVHFLVETIRKLDINRKDLLNCTIAHRFWIYFAKHAFVLCCKTRNLLKIGI